MAVRMRPIRSFTKKPGAVQSAFADHEEIHKMLHQDVLAKRCRRRLVHCIAVAASLSVADAWAAPATWTVTNCSESSSDPSNDLSTHRGVLRYVIANASSGDVVDLAELSCSTITLKTGALVVNHQNLTLNGPGADRLTITGFDNGKPEPDRILYDSTGGTLTINDLSISGGYVLDNNPLRGARGGCIYSNGSVVLNHSKVSFCEAKATAAHSVAFGGGVFAEQNLTLNHSTLSSNVVSPFGSDGGGAYTPGNLVSRFCTIDGNVAGGHGGGLAARGGTYILGTAISNNSASVGGGIAKSGQGDFTATNSTISGNTGNYFVGGLALENTNTVSLRNMTIAFNTGGRPPSYYNGHYGASGVALLSGGNINTSVLLDSTIISNNTYFGSAGEADMSALTSDGASITLSGSNNLVPSPIPGSLLPKGNTACPLLGPLRDNGGPTWTHALLSGSPAIDQGTDVAFLPEDQRGTMRSGFAPDIGAYEVQHGDVIFNSGFDGCGS